MKNTLKAMCTAALTRIKRAALLFEIRSLEIMIDGQCQALECVSCPLTTGKIILARHNARAELARVRAAYSATLPVGERPMWRMA